MKILHIIDHLGLGGAQSLVEGIFNGQIANKRIFLFSLRKTEVIKTLNHPNIFIHSSKHRYSLSSIRLIFSLVKREKIDLIHCHLLKSQLYGYFLKLMMGPKIKLIFHEHGRVFQKNVLYTLFLMLAKNKVDLFIAVSETTKRYLSEKIKIDPFKIVKLYNFIDLNEFNQQVDPRTITNYKNRLSIEANEFVIGFVGRLVESKGWREFIYSVPKLIKEYIGFKFLIAGDGRNKPQLLSLIQSLGIQDHVIFMGYQSKMKDIYALLDCLVVPSYRESMGLTVIEAKAMGVPVVSSDVPALNEIIQNGIDGLLFKLQDVDDLVEKVLLVFSNKKLRERLIKNGLVDAKSFSIEHYLNELDKIYKGICVS